MSELLYHSKYDKKLKYFRQFIDKIDELPDEIPDFVDDALAYDARKVAENMERNFEDYINTFGDMKEIAKEKNRPQPTIKIHRAIIGNKEVRANINFTVGKNTYYYEYGTGPVGEGKFGIHGGKGATQPSYPPEELPSWWKYSSGPNVIPAGSADDYFDLDGLPQWYINKAMKNPSVTSNYPMWMSPMGVSFGIPAGMFYYKAVQAYLDDLYDPANELGYPDAADPDSRKGIRSMRLRLRAYFED